MSRTGGKNMLKADRYLEELIRELGIHPSSDSAENDRPKPTDEKQEKVPSEQPQRDEGQCTVASPWAA
jgi:hypothetical protein